MSNRFANKFISVLIAILTVATTFVAMLQSQAGNNDDRAGRDANRLALEAMGLRVEGQARVNYDFDYAYQAWWELDTLAFASDNRGDSVSAERYRMVRDSVRALSPIMQAPYFDESTISMDLARYETDVYLTEVTRLQEMFSAAAAVKDAWDTKANIYVVQLTILAVALFLLGLSATIQLGMPKVIFASVGSVMGSFAIVWAVATYIEDVPDLRANPVAIPSYAEGMSLSHRGLNEEAVQAFDRALASAPTYANAYVGRALAHMGMGNYEAAIPDFRQAQELGNNQAYVAGNYAYSLLLLDRYDEAIAVNLASIANGNAELWQRFDVGLAQLSAGRFEQAQAAYQAAMDEATAQVASARQTGVAVSSSLWWSLDDGVRGLNNYLGWAEAGLVVNGEQGTPIAQALRRQIMSLSVSLEYRGEPPSAPLSAQVSEMSFGQPLYGEDGVFSDYNLGFEFDYGIQEVDVLFNYAQMRDGQDIVVKVRINGREDPSWRVVRTWDGGAEGIYFIPLSIAYSDTFVLNAGIYEVALYVDGQLAAESAFEVLPQE